MKQNTCYKKQKMRKNKTSLRHIYNTHEAHTNGRYVLSEM